jgi:hypothetical protein
MRLSLTVGAATDEPPLGVEATVASPGAFEAAVIAAHAAAAHRLHAPSGADHLSV